MTLIVEDGTNVSGAESYQTVSGADTYHSNRGNTDWDSLTTTAKEQALRKATDYMQQAYRGMWKGYRTNTSQALDWPRQCVVLDDSFWDNEVSYNTIPNEIKAACSELALRASAADLIDDHERATISESIGSISVTYAQGASQDKVYRSIDMMLRPFFSYGLNTVHLVRS